MPDAITYFFPWLDAQTSKVTTDCTLRSFDGCKVPFWLLVHSWAGHQSWDTERRVVWVNIGAVLRIFLALVLILTLSIWNIANTAIQAIQWSVCFALQLIAGAAWVWIKLWAAQPCGRGMVGPWEGVYCSSVPSGFRNSGGQNCSLSSWFISLCDRRKHWQGRCVRWEEHEIFTLRWKGKEMGLWNRCSQLCELRWMLISTGNGDKK